jgi:hypothetical protein
VLHAHQNRFCLREEAEGLGFQIDKHGTHTETLQICPVDKPVLGSCPISLRHPVKSSDNQEHRTPLVGPHHQPRYARCVVEPTRTSQNNTYNSYNVHNVILEIT